MNAHHYRKNLYEKRAHPKSSSASNKSQSHSIYPTLFGFIFAEILFEVLYAPPMAGVVFPFGFLLFWAFYYTLVSPETEETVVSTKHKTLSDLPQIFFMIYAMIIRLVVREISILFLKQDSVRSTTSKRKATPSATLNFKSQPKQSPNPASTIEPLPQNIESALITLGLPSCRSWRIIQHQYRTLAKKYHPDLNPDITLNGNRFMRIDSAYRTLESQKRVYFK